MNSQPSFYIKKIHKKVMIVDSNDNTLYCPPNFIRLISRNDLDSLLREANLTGTLHIRSIMAFERNARRS